MKIVGVTGGIGSGKSTVARMFASKGIPVYTADDEAKKLMNSSKVIKRQLTKLLGDKCYKNGEINKAYVSSQIFNDKSLLQQINAIVHPKVGAHFKRWLKKQTAPYIIKEAAIIFENNLQHQYDVIITVVADKNTRIERILKRQKTTKEDIEKIIKNQLYDEEKIKLSNYVIYNQDIEETSRQVSNIHHELLESLS
jgi:dephospho-CoA kinase